MVKEQQDKQKQTRMDTMMNDVWKNEHSFHKKEVKAT